MVAMKTNCVHFQMEYGFVRIGQRCRMKRYRWTKPKWEDGKKKDRPANRNIWWERVIWHERAIEKKHLNDSNKSSCRSWRIFIDDNDDDCIGTILIWWTLASSRCHSFMIHTHRSPLSNEWCTTIYTKCMYSFVTWCWPFVQYFDRHKSASNSTAHFM